MGWTDIFILFLRWTVMLGVGWVLAKVAGTDGPNDTFFIVTLIISCTYTLADKIGAKSP